MNALEDCRREASRKIHQALKGAYCVMANYSSRGALACGIYTDGVHKYLYVPYGEDTEEGQHQAAMRKVEELQWKEVARAL